MENSRTDPRVVKTRNNLKQALVHLMKEYKIENISVQKITETASITRGTFYLHYKDKQDFIDRAMNGILDDFFENVMIEVYSLAGKSYPNGVKVFSMQHAFKYIEDEADAFDVLLNNPENVVFFDRLSDRVGVEINHFYEKLEPDFVELDVPTDIQIALIVSAELGLIKYWLQKGMIYTPRYMSSSVTKLMTQLKHDKIFFTDFFYTEA